MATVTERRQSWQPTDTDRRVRHPLQAVRGYIRAYVAIEGLMIAVIFLAAWFWIGMALDFGSFKAFPIRQNADQSVEFGGFDWIQGLQWMSPPGQDTAAIVRIVLICVLVVTLLALIAFKVFMRLFVEFSDPALALVLERRFPKELGDRLITAVEMADPRMSDKYGLSRAMIQKTINDAAERVEQLPVSHVFNWRRLRWLTLGAFALTFGLYLLLWGIFIGTAAAVGAEDEPLDFFYRFNHVAGTWAERNVLVMNSYWPRQAHLEIVRFQDTKQHPDEMKIGKEDQQRPDIQVRGVRWVIADRGSPDGWRSLRWKDLLDPDRIGDEELTRYAKAVDFPELFPSWSIDLNDISERVPVSILPSAWQNKTSGEIRTAMQQAEFQSTIESLARQEVAAILLKHFEDAKIPADKRLRVPVPKEVLKTAEVAATEIELAPKDLLNWKSWTVDRLELQCKKGEIREALRRKHSAALRSFEDVLSRLDYLTNAVYMDRVVRQLDVPVQAEVYFQGKTRISSAPVDRNPDQKYAIGLGELKESVEFTIRGHDFYTRPRKITLVPPPTIAYLKVDKEEPAYIHYRVQGDQAQLKDLKQVFKDVSISVNGVISIVQVPHGTNLVLTAKADRDLKPGIFIYKSENVKSEKGKPAPIAPQVDIVRTGTGEEQKRTFAITLNNVDREYDFQFEFIDEDNVKGKRRVQILLQDDNVPDVTLELDPQVILRKLAVQKGARSADADGYLVTPDALIPFKGMIRDDNALTDAKWLFETKLVELDLGSRVPTRQSDEVSLVVSGMQYNPIHAGMSGASVYWTWVMASLKASAGTSRPVVEETTPLVEFQRRLLGVSELPLTAIKDAIKEDMFKSKLKRQAMLREHNIQDESGFDFRQFFPRLKVNDPSRESQPNYQVKVYVTARDNNVETGPSDSLKPKSTTFLVVSENELLTQVFIEEEVIREQLEKIILQLQDARARMDEQVTALSSPGAKVSLVAIQVSEAQKAASNTASRTRDVHRNYSRILTELKVNRVKPTKIEAVEYQIVRPLSTIVDPNTKPDLGNFATTEDALGQLYQAVNADAAVVEGYKEGEEIPQSVLNNIEKNRPNHLMAAQQSRNHMDRLIEALKTVLANMEEGITDARLTALLAAIERDQARALQRLQLFHDEEVRRILEALGASN